MQQTVAGRDQATRAATAAGWRTAAGRLTSRLAPSEGRPTLLLAAVALATLPVLVFVVVRPISLFTHARSSAGSIGLEPLEVFLGDDSGGVEHYLLGVAAVVAIYLLAYAVALRCRGRAALALVLGCATLFALIMLATFPAGSDDIYTNIINGRMAWLYHLNPMVVAPNAVPHDPLYPSVLWRDEPSYYGPVWYLLLAFPTRAVTADFVANLIAFRALLIPFFVGAAYLAGRVAGARSPRYGTAAALLVGFSPLLLWEIIGNGHNDIVMAFFAIFAAERALRRDWTFALPLLALSILSKYATAVLLPLFLIHALRDEGRRALRPLLVGAVLAAGASVLAFLRFWDGFGSFDALLHNGADRMTSSPAVLLAAFLHGGLALPSWAISVSVDMENARRISLALYALCWLVIAVRLWRGRADLLSSCFYALFFYAMLASVLFYPAYLCTMLVFGAALVPRREVLLAVLFSCCGLLGHVVQAWGDLLFAPYTTLAPAGTFVGLVFLPAFIFWLTGLPRPAWLANAFHPWPAG
jgi:hypothetical protein